MLVAKNVAVAFRDKRILEDVSLTLEKGRIFSILGPNGAGKSTLLKCLTGFLKISAGEIFLGQRSFKDISLDELSRKRAVLTQQTVLDFPLTVKEVASMGRPSNAGFSGHASVDDIVDHALALTSTNDLANRLFSTLSGGEQQRVHLARVIAQVWDQEDAILFLDEPTSALDLKHQFMLFDICRQLCDQKGFSIVTVLHDLRLAKEVSDISLFLKNGRVFSQGMSDATITSSAVCDLYELKPQQVFL